MQAAQPHPSSVKQAVASYSRRHHLQAAGSSLNKRADQFRVASYVVHTPPPSSAALRYASQLAFSPRRSSRIACLETLSPPGPAASQPKPQLQEQEQPPAAYVPSSPPPASCLNGSATTSNSSCTPHTGATRAACWQPASSAPATTTTTTSTTTSKLVSPTALAHSPARGPPDQSRHLSPPGSQNESAPNNMGDYLSTPYVSTRVAQQQQAAHSQPIAAANGFESQDDSDCNTPKFQYKRKFPPNSQPAAAAKQACEITPRLPRGVSRIPHQIYQQAKRNCEQEQEAARDERSRYLTFSKDQATSHAIRSIKELAVAASAGNKQAAAAPIADSEGEETENSTLLVVEPTPQRDDSCQRQPPVPVERQLIKSRDSSLSRINLPSAKSNNFLAPSENSETLLQKTASSSSCRSQPICEAFIMTGQSMLKLSCTETNNNNTQSLPNGNSHNRLPHHNQTLETRSDQVCGVAAKLDNNQFGTTDGSQCRRNDTTDVGQVSVMGIAQERSRHSSPDLDPRTVETSATTTEAPTTTATSHNQIASQPTPSQSPDSTVREEEPPSSSFEETTVQVRRLIVDKECQINQAKEVDSIELNKQSATPNTEPSNMGDKSSLIEESACNSSPLGATGGCTYDRDSAKRLAKRLYSLSGFKKSDVSHHLGKTNEFSEMVAEEYLNLFDFKSMKLDAALRKFLSKFQLNGETQERERILSRFSQRYYICNSDKFPSSDIVQTLVCALILLNTDMHTRHGFCKKKRKKSQQASLSLGAFIDGLNSSVVALAEASQQDSHEFPLMDSTGNHLLQKSSSIALNPAEATCNPPAVPYCFPRHMLVDLYEAIKKKPLKSNEENCDMSMFESELDKIYSQHQNNQAATCRSSTLPTRRFLLPTGGSMPAGAAAATMNSQTKHRYRLGLNKLDLFDNGGKCAGRETGPINSLDTDKTIQFKAGYLNKKRTFEANGKPTPKGKRGWTRVHVILADLSLIFQVGLKEAPQNVKEFRGALESSPKETAKQMKNSVKIYHSLAKPTSTYKKRNHVFHLELADQSELLLQASDQAELSAWVEAINFSAGCLSAPVLPPAVSSKTAAATAAANRHQHHDNKLPLPATYTRLSYWDQLVNHEERLQKLRSDLEEHLASASNIKSAKKSCKNRFIERIAYLRHEIQRYAAYVELMRKKSNSTEALALSKNPHLLANFGPSEKMMKLLPSIGSFEAGQPAQLEPAQEQAPAPATQLA